MTQRETAALAAAILRDVTYRLIDRRIDIIDRAPVGCVSTRALSRAMTLWELAPLNNCDVDKDIIVYVLKKFILFLLTSKIDERCK